MKNVILLITDTFRYDNLADHATRPVRTPCLDAFAESRATSIEGFYTASFPTIPHRTDVATGVLGWPHYPWQPISRSGPNHIAGSLGAQGYATQLICDCPHLFNSRFQHAFDAAFQHRGQEGDKHLLQLNRPIRETVPPTKVRTRPAWRGANLTDLHRWMNRYFESEEDTFAARTAATATRWLEENHVGTPFFLWVDFFDPHEPWDPPEYMVRRYQPDYDGEPMLHCNYGPATDYTPDELTNLWAHYAAESEMVDRHLGRVLQKIDDLMLWDDTIVVVTSDHGTSLGEHNRTGKSNISDHDDRYWPIYPEVGHVPFLVGGGEVPPGARRPQLAPPPDLQPTIAEFAGFDSTMPKPVEGKSFAGAVQNGSGQHREIAVSAGFVRPGDDGRCPPTSVTPFAATENWGYAPCGSDGKPELYNLAQDPNAATNVAGEHPSELAEMAQRFDAFMADAGVPESVRQCWAAGTS